MKECMAVRAREDNPDLDLRSLWPRAGEPISALAVRLFATELFSNADFCIYVLL